jgi:PIN domain nuclease of toxin-antitoxin system
MRYLLDTHTVIWVAENSPRLSETAAKTILDTNSNIYVSIVSAWEVAIKCSLGKLKVDGGVSEFFRIIRENGFLILPINAAYVECVQRLPFIHRDPFDRMLVATAATEGMTIVTADKNIFEYGVPCIW